LALAKEYRLNIRASQFHLRLPANGEKKPTATCIERYSDRYENAPEAPLDFDWSDMPKELCPGHRKKTAARKRPAEARRGKAGKASGSAADVSQKLEMLEKREKLEKDGKDAAAGNKGEDDEEGDQNGEDNASDVEEEKDEEMDEGTDYVNSYFDNGEGYADDEDDNLDEGGIY